MFHRETGTREHVIHTGPLSKVLDKTERWLDTHGGIRPGPQINDPATADQIRYLRAFHLDGTTMTRREASTAINKAILERDQAQMRAINQLTPDDIARLLNAGDTIEQLAKRMSATTCRADAMGVLRRLADNAATHGLLTAERVAS